MAQDAKKILVVDDERECCEFFRDYLVKRGHEVDVAYDGSEAAGLLDSGGYDVIFFDCNMPEMSGIEFLKVIKKKNPEAGKVMISGYDLMDEPFARQLGVDMFLAKPVSLASIDAAIEKAGTKDCGTENG